MLYNAGYTQVHGGLEQYLYYSKSGPSVIVPRAYYTSKHNWYAEMRYNYEELETLSINAGRVFSGKGPVSYSITPVMGFVVGKINGGTLGSKINVDYKKLFFASEFQYTFSIEKRTENFFFNWSELGYQFTNRAYTGIALQFTHPYETKNNWEPGVMIGITYRNWTLPFYAFNPMCNKRNFVVGINWEWKNANQVKPGL